MKSPSSHGDWPELRQNSALGGHQTLPGAIARPEIAWRHYLGGGLFDAEPVPLGDRHGLLVLYGGVIHCYDIVGNLIWRSVAMGFEGISRVVDLDNDGRLEIVAGNGKRLFVLSADTGEILWSAYHGPPAACGFMHTAALVHHFPRVGAGMQIVVGLLSSNEVIVYDCTPGASKIERVRTLWMDDFFHPSILAVDIDGDGFDEIVVTKYSAIYSFCPATGELKSVCRWESGGTPKRNYGLFLAADVVGSGAPGFVVLSEKVSKHLSVIANDGAGNLSLLWDRFLEHIYPDDRRELRYSFNSLCDIDGDGRLEIIVSLFDEVNGGAWWLEVIDATTGRIRQRIEDLYLHGIQQLLPGSPPVVCVTTQFSRLPARFAESVLLQWKDGALQPVYRSADSSFAGRFLPQSAIATAFRADLPASSEIWTVRRGEETGLLMIGRNARLSLLVGREGEWVCREIPCALDVNAVVTVFDLDGDDNDEIVVSDDRGEVRVINLDGESLGRIRVGMRLRHGTGAYYRSKPMQVPVVATHLGSTWLAVPDAGSRIHLLALPPGAGRPITLWQRQGRGRCGPEETYHSVGFDTFSDSPGVLMSTSDGTTAALQLVGIDGEPLWTREVAGLPLSPSYDSDRIGIYEYRIVHEEEGAILFVSGYRSMSMNSEESIGLSLGSGEEIWRRVTIGEGENGRGFGPWNASALSVAPRRSMLLLLAKDTVALTYARTGAPAAEPWQLRPHNTAHLKRRGLRVDDFAAYGSLVPYDVDQDGLLEMVICGAYGGVGVIGSDGEMRWWQSAPLSTLSGAFFGIADIDDDGVVELGMSQADGDFVVLRADDGLEKWRLPIGEVATDVITCDIDGDGQMEFIATTQQGGVLCIGVNGSGSGLVKWRLDLGYSLGPPIAADIDGDGRSEIVVVSGDGSLYAISGAGRLQSKQALHKRVSSRQ